MFNIAQIGKILKATNRLNIPAEFNASLPLTISVKKQLNPIRYLLQLGTKEIEVKSYKELEVGKKYKAEIFQKNEKIEIKNLSKFPTIFDKMPKNLNYKIEEFLRDNFKDAHKILSEKNLTDNILNIIQKSSLKNDGLNENKNYRHFLLHHLANANSKEEFIFFSQLLLADAQNIKHLFINEQGRRALMQFKYKKRKLKFYAFFENLGAIGGELFLIDDIYLNLMVEFQKSLELISNYLHELKGIKITIKKEKVKPLFEINENSLLNLKV